MPIYPQLCGCTSVEGQMLLKNEEIKIIDNINFKANIPLTMIDIGGGLDVFRTYNLTQV